MPSAISSRRLPTGHCIWSAATRIGHDRSLLLDDVERRSMCAKLNESGQMAAVRSS